MFDYIGKPIVRIPVIVGVGLAVGAIVAQIAGVATGVISILITGFVLELAFYFWLIDYGA